MLKALLARARQGHRTMRYPDGAAAAAGAFPRRAVDRSRPAAPRGAARAPTPAPRRRSTSPADGPRSTSAAASSAPSATRPAPRARSRSRRTTGSRCARARTCGSAPARSCRSRRRSTRSSARLFGRSLKLRVVSAGGCNACEADVNVLSTIGWDLGRFGIQVVASPRHADGLLITGPVTENMRARPAEDVRRGPPAEDRHRRRRLRDLAAASTRATPSSTTARRPSCRSTSSSPAARRTRSRSWTGCCDWSAGSDSRSLGV